MGQGGGTLFLIQNKSVQEELKITEEQKTKIKEFVEKNPAPKRDPNADREERAAAMKKLAEATDKFAKETLTEEQQKRVKQIGLQTGGILGAANNEETAKALKITDEQKTTFKEIGDQLGKDRRELFQGGGGFGNPETMKKAQALQKEASDKAVAALTDEQKKTWTEMTGKPFEIKIEGFGGGSAKGKGKKKVDPA